MGVTIDHNRRYLSNAMSINRRRFLESASELVGALPWATERARAQSISKPRCRTFKLTTQIEVLKPTGVTRVWAPVALVQNPPFQKLVRNTLHCETGQARIVKSAGGFDLIA